MPQQLLLVMARGTSIMTWASRRAVISAVDIIHAFMAAHNSIPRKPAGACHDLEPPLLLQLLLQQHLLSAIAPLHLLLLRLLLTVIRWHVGECFL